MDGINPTAVIFGVLGAMSIVLVTFLRLIFDKCSNENTLKARAAELDKKAFKAENELLIIKRDCKCKDGGTNNLLG